MDAMITKRVMVLPRSALIAGVAALAASIAMVLLGLGAGAPGASPGQNAPATRQALAPIAAMTAIVAMAARSGASRPATGDDFGEPQRVAIHGYTGDALEPFISRDGAHLFFNNGCSPAESTDLYFARRIDDGDFDFLGPVPGVNLGPPVLDAVPSLDREGNFFFITTRAYAMTGETIFTGRFSGQAVHDVRPVAGNTAPHQVGWLTIDAEVSADGRWLYFANGELSGGPAPVSSYLAVAEKIGGEFQVTPRSSNLLRAVASSSPADLDYGPAISADNLELFFTRWSPPAPLPVILHATRTDPTAPFGPPSRIAVIRGFAEAPSIAADGRTLYYHQRDATGHFAIHRVTRRR
jgi:hypothetical protein